MSDDPRHQFSSVTIAGAARALGKLGWADAVLGRVSPASAQVFANHSAQRFHDGAALDEVLELVAQLHGVDGAARLMTELVRGSISRVLAPLARVVLALASNNPRALLERIDSLVRGVSRGLHCTFLAEGERVGVVSIRYPVPCSPAIAHGWRGALLFLLEFCGVQGEVQVLEAAEPSVGRLHVAWQRPRQVELHGPEVGSKR